MNAKHCLIGAVFALSTLGATSVDDGDAQVEHKLARVKEIHGGTGPWAVAGYRIGERALKDLGLERQSFRLMVIHQCPQEVQFSCMADGLQAATGASPGKLNLKVENAPLNALCTVVKDRETGRTLKFTLLPEFMDTIRDVPFEQLEAEGKRVAEMPEDKIFGVVEVRDGK